MMVVAGTIVHKWDRFCAAYDQMAEPKYVVAMGACAISGGPFVNSYHVINGADKIIPVDVYPGLSATSRIAILRITAIAAVKVRNFLVIADVPPTIRTTLIDPNRQKLLKLRIIK